MRDEAERRIGHLYPKVTLPKEQGGGEATVIAWLWARTVTCPNPACGAEMPLISSFWLSKKKGKETWLVPKVTGKDVSFEVRSGRGEPPDPPKQGRGAKFACLVCGQVAPEKHVKAEGIAGRMGQRLMAIVAEGRRGRAYVAADSGQEATANSAKSDWEPTQDLPNDPRNFWTPLYGLKTYGDLFTERQLVALTTFSDLVGEVRERVLTDAVAAGLPDDATRLADGGSGAVAYADAIATYLAFILSKQADLGNSLNRWEPNAQCPRQLFGRQAIPMIWDFAEGNPLGDSSGAWNVLVKNEIRVMQAPLFNTQAEIAGRAVQADATAFQSGSPALVSTDPPYYDNIGYADLSDFFYVWLRKSLDGVWPDLFRTLLVPKSEELVATPYRFEGGKAEAERHFEAGLRATFRRMATIQNPEFPMTVYYAFKQAETEERGDGGNSTASTGWETMLEGLINSGFQITGTWPMRTEMATRMIASGTNALASSIVLACRVRDDSAPEATRQQFLRELRQKLAADLRPLQQASIAPVDLAQAAIGPGMAIYSKYRRVREASGDALKVRGALGLINQVLDEVLAEQDEEYDNATRWAVSWYEQYGMNEGDYGNAETLARARNVAVGELAHDGVVTSARGKVRFVWREEYADLPSAWRPGREDVSDWVIMQRLAHAIQSGQEQAAAVKAKIDAALPGRTDTARDLAYRVYNIAERKSRTREALVYNTLVQNWPQIESQAAMLAPSDIEMQLGLDA